eukprot:TRINITY_DN2069_c0_g1_i6.p1 TRINITY_DN2069_c0_g1~~TRINITY_DN2069_c0_g1_i6.p1  ORF type:complete len:419 (-),score=78.13 TRINITY_DN2069_c0_g1_i6:383-1639(-)
MQRILIAEDDTFQRLALIDILEFYNYDITAVENGRLARDELLKEDAYFDLVLLDLMMPEMTGLELLRLMKAHEKLQNIPVIMMSSDDQNKIIATCLEEGAKDYLIKPIRIGNVKNLQSHIVFNPEKQPNPSQKDSYQKIRYFVKKSASSVELIQRLSDGEYFALKIIAMHFMTPQERKQAQNEITLLKVLKGPTIIRYYESFIENECINIIMEYADLGNLSKIISEASISGRRLSTDQILAWMAQIVLGIMLMHSKNILHRDIKTQNMFLTKGKKKGSIIVKLGDFGIAKDLGTQGDFAKTCLETSYFMSPEVIKGDQYGQKADIWAIGCALYEMACLRRPFQHEQLSVVFDLIKTKEPDSLPPDVDENIKRLIESMLQKDPINRPTIFEIASQACISAEIKKFVDEENSQQLIEKQV